jgi:hypothetical protein
MLNYLNKYFGWEASSRQAMQYDNITLRGGKSTAW